ncbi:hypothetical protein M758_UG072600 [Ceratodon purpureus]|nr:hypothetical protein M758_UG072600 [Ceratodon purpureus]
MLESLKRCHFGLDALGTHGTLERRSLASGFHNRCHPLPLLQAHRLLLRVSILHSLHCEERQHGHKHHTLALGSRQYPSLATRIEGCPFSLGLDHKTLLLLLFAELVP